MTLVITVSILIVHVYFAGCNYSVNSYDHHYDTFSTVFQCENAFGHSAAGYNGKVNVHTIARALYGFG
jgi:hypothetical protein